MNIKKIRLKNFRNYLEQEIILSEGLNVFFGDNAQGKTNIIEAIFMCAVGKSFRVKKEKELINFEKEKSEIEIEYEKTDRQGKIKIEIGDKKYIYNNNIKLKKISDLLGNINVVTFSPDDINIIKNGPSNRRRFLNIMISQLRPKYLYNLNLYLKTLEERNNYLRQVKTENNNDNLLDVYDNQLANYGEIIFNYRKEFIKKIIKKINIIHKEITKEKEELKIIYKSDCELKEKYLKKLKEERKNDIKRGYTNKGIHKDDFIIYINDKQVDLYGSQGQQRTVILSLKLSELNIIYDEINEYPILLLDDFMSELDENRRKSFLNNIKNIQVLITCTENIEIEEVELKRFNVISGHVCERN